MTRDDIVVAARRWAGTPYRHHAATRGAGCDCIGLLVGVWQDIAPGTHVTLPAYGADWRDTRHSGELLRLAGQVLVPAAGDPLAGQVLLFRMGATQLPRHCGIVLGAGRFIHAQEGFGVVEANLTDGWRRRIAGQFDFPEL